MTALLELKQKIKNFFGLNEIYFLPILKFAIAYLFFRWINANTGYMPQLGNSLLPPVLSLICCILPHSITVLVGVVLIILQCYGLSMETAGFMAVLILLLLIFFLRFSSGTSLVLAMTPLAFAFGIPVMLPIGAGLLSTAASSIPAGCGVVLYYMIRFIKSHEELLADASIEPVKKLQVMADGIVLNWGMWIAVVAFILVILLVNLIRTRSFDYAWHVAIVLGGITYVAVMMVGSSYLGDSVTVDVTYLMASTLIAVVAGLILEFFFFGGDYSRSERLEFEDDDYYYYVKAVPKASVPSSQRRIKKINAEPAGEDILAQQTPQATYANPIFHEDGQPPQIDLEKKLEESLRDL